MSIQGDRQTDNVPHTNPQMTKAELRKSQKPIMEKRRRARINSYLNELKVLVLKAMKKHPSRDVKLEKADILELTVKHLQKVQRQQLPVALHLKTAIVEKFKTGFTDCAEEVNRFVSRLENIDNGMKSRLRNHLNGCVNNLQLSQDYVNVITNPLSIGNMNPEFSFLSTRNPLADFSSPRLSAFNLIIKDQPITSPVSTSVDSLQYHIKTAQPFEFKLDLMEQFQHPQVSSSTSAFDSSNSIEEQSPDENSDSFMLAKKIKVENLKNGCNDAMWRPW